MLGGRIDREAWAREIDALMVRFDPGSNGEGNKSAFARRIGLTRQTLKRWSAHETDVSRESVGQVLDRLGLSQEEQTDLLTRVGYLTPGIMPPPTYPDPNEDRVIKHIKANPDLTEKERAELIQAQREQIEADFRRRQADYERIIRMRRRDVS